MWMIIVFVHIVVVNWILIQKQALSGGTYHNCPNCGLEFREDNTNLTLTNAHEGTRARNKYLYKSFTIGEWQNIFSDNLSNSEINEIYEYKNNGFSSIDCPLCHNRLNIYEKDGLFSDSIILMCNTCKTSFKQENNLYKFMSFYFWSNCQNQPKFMWFCQLNFNVKYL